MCVRLEKRMQKKKPVSDQPQFPLHKTFQNVGLHDFGCVERPWFDLFHTYAHPRPSNGLIAPPTLSTIFFRTAGITVTCISKIQFTYRSFIRLTILGHYATFGIEAEVLGSCPQARKNVVFAHALHFAA